jgi:hypothetical protein
MRRGRDEFSGTDLVPLRQIAVTGPAVLRAARGYAFLAARRPRMTDTQSANASLPSEGV